jgi:hypothetical protein
VAVRISADVTTPGGAFTTKTRNLSVGGVCLECAEEMSVGTRLHVLLFLVTEDVEDTTVPQLEVDGTVAWSAPGGGTEPATAGVRFDPLWAPQVAKLARFLKLITRR